MTDPMVSALIERVIARLAPMLGATGERGGLVTVFSGATAGFPEAFSAVRNLIMAGFSVGLVFSPAAEALYGTVARGELAGFPHVTEVPPSGWLKSIQEARAVIVPLLSVATAAKVARLTPDTLAANCILHGLLMGKPVIAAVDGASPESEGRRHLGFHRGTPALRAALSENLETLRRYGCTLVPAASLAGAVCAAVAPGPHAPALDAPAPLPPSGRVVTVADVRRAAARGAGVALLPGTPVTPLARDAARALGVALIRTVR